MADVVDYFYRSNPILLFTLAASAFSPDLAASDCSPSSWCYVCHERHSALTLTPTQTVICRSNDLWKGEEQAVDREWEARLIKLARREKECDGRRLTWHTSLERGQISDGSQGAILEGKRASAMRKSSDASPKAADTAC